MCFFISLPKRCCSMNSMSMRRSFKLLVGCLLLSPVAVFAEAQLQVQDAWIKLAPPGARVNAAYMTLVNNLADDKVIVAVSADCCAQVMMHQTRREGDRVFMDHHDSLRVPAQASLELAPGDLHLMLLGAKVPLVVDLPVNFTFEFADGEQQQFSIAVKKAANE